MEPIGCYVSCEIRASRIPGAGLGLFVTEDVPPGMAICEYIGEKIWLDDVEKYPGTRYSFCYGKHMIVEPYPEKMCAGAYINDARGSLFSNNCEFIISRLDEYGYQYVSEKEYTVLICALDDTIPAGSELFIDYGDAYWEGWGDINFEMDRMSLD